MCPVRSQSACELLIVGEFFFDFVFYGLPRVPRLGEEVKTASFGLFPGGGLATTALVAAKLGTKTEIVTRVGQDAVSNPAWRALVRSGIHTRNCELDSQLPTALTVCCAFAGDRMMVTYDAINKDLVRLFLRKAVQDQIRRARHIHLACSLVPHEKWLPKIRALVQQGMSLSADIGWNPETLRSSRLTTLLKGFEFLFPNEAEARAITGKSSVEAAARELARWIRIPVVKMGQHGSIAVCEGKILRAKPLRVKSVDATGSGDAFNGGFLHGYLAGWRIEDCLRAGNVCGALAASAAGGSSSIPTQKQLRRLMQKL